MDTLSPIHQRTRSISEYRPEVILLSVPASLITTPPSLSQSSPPLLNHYHHPSCPHLPPPFSGVPATEVLKKGLEDLHSLCDHVLKTFHVSGHHLPFSPILIHMYIHVAVSQFCVLLILYMHAVPTATCTYSNDCCIAFESVMQVYV